MTETMIHIDDRRFDDPIEAMDAGRRWCYTIPHNAYRDDNGVVPSLVVEGVPGHFPMLGNGEHATPWYWGGNIVDAERACVTANARRGVSESDAKQIVGRSMMATIRRQPMTLREMAEVGI